MLVFIGLICWIVAYVCFFIDVRFFMCVSNSIAEFVGVVFFWLGVIALIVYASQRIFS